MENSNILKKLEAGIAGFSKSQKRIAQYIIEHYDKAAFMTAARLGKTIDVSESTVVRFAAELGFEGIPPCSGDLGDDPEGQAHLCPAHRGSQ